MQKILQVISLACFSLSCYSLDTDDCFLKVSKGVYVQYHSEPALGNRKVKISRFTSTYVKTYGETEPSSVWNMQTINYTASNVNLFKDYDNNCCIDIYESFSNPNKCRIVGINGKNIHIGPHCFSIYDVSNKEKSFVQDEPRLIFLDNSGLYIVSAQKNSIDKIIDTYRREKSFEFQNPVIEISAIYGNRTINGKAITADDFLDESFSFQPSCSEFPNTRLGKTFFLNCSFKTPMIIGLLFGPVTKLYPALQQIEQISAVKLTSPPPSEKSVIKRISEILGLEAISDMLVIRDGKVYLVDVAQAVLRGEIPGITWSVDDVAQFYDYANALQNFIPLIDQKLQWANRVQACLNIDLLVKTGMIKEYLFDTSMQALTNRQQIAMQMWEDI